MTRRMIVKLFVGSLIGLAAGFALLFLGGGLALSNDVFVTNGPDVVGVRSGALAWVLLGLALLGLLIMGGAAIAVFLAWIGAVLNTAELPSKTWCVVLLVVGLLGFAFIATLAYVVAGPDGLEQRPQVSQPSGSPPRVPAAVH
jgi:hypothetical protein